MIKAVIFDMGGVLLRTMDQTARRLWEQRLGLAGGELAELFFNSPQGQAAQRGEVDEESHWLWLGKQLGLHGEELAECRHAFYAGDQLDHSLLDLIRRLRSRYQIALLSNAMNGLRQMLTDTFPMIDLFDLIVVSAEEGITKPDPRIFHRTLQRLACTPVEAVFIDDFIHNVVGARAVGMHAIQFTPDMDLPAQLRTIGVF